MKLVKLFVQVGAAGIHLDDLLSGTKRFDGKDGEGWIITPTCEAVRRLTAARFQMDMMRFVRP
jgi:isocitrate lyase